MWHKGHEEGSQKQNEVLNFLKKTFFFQVILWTAFLAVHLAVLTSVKADPGWGKYRSYGSYYGHYRTPRYAQQSTPYSKYKICN